MTPQQAILTFILLMAAVVTAKADNTLQYFKGGTMRDTMILVNSDNARMNMFAAVEIRANIPGTKERMKPWHEGFGVQMATTDSSYLRIMLYPANTDYGFLTDQQGMLLKVIRHTDKGDSTIVSKIVVDGIAPGRYNNSLSVSAYRSGKVLVFAGKKYLAKVAEIDYPDPTQGERYAVVDGKVNVKMLVDEYAMDPAATLHSEWTHSKLQEYFRTPRATLKPLEGYWQYLDQDTDETYAHIGGHYRLAVVDNGAGGYNIIYVSGATIYPDRWETGMLKGNLTSTIFPGNYDLHWIDSEMRPVDREAYATVEQDGTLLSLVIPTLKSTMRLYRVPWDN